MFRGGKQVNALAKYPECSGCLSNHSGRCAGYAPNEEFRVNRGCCTRFQSVEMAVLSLLVYNSADVVLPGGRVCSFEKSNAGFASRVYFCGVEYKPQSEEFIRVVHTGLKAPHLPVSIVKRVVTGLFSVESLSNVIVSSMRGLPITDRPQKRSLLQS